MSESNFIWSCIYIYISNIQSASKDSGCGLFTYRIYKEFHINLWECSMFPTNCTIYIYIYIGGVILGWGFCVLIWDKNSPTLLGLQLCLVMNHQTGQWLNNFTSYFCSSNSPFYLLIFIPSREEIRFSSIFQPICHILLTLLLWFNTKYLTFRKDSYISCNGNYFFFFL